MVEAARVLLNALRAHGYKVIAVKPNKLFVRPPVPEDDPVRQEIVALKPDLMHLLEQEEGQKAT